MARTFSYNFTPPSDDPVPGPTVDLEVNEIEDAGIREVLQTPGAAYGSWAMLDALLTATGPGTPFRFREPLGQAREVKVALSGLFGRFVARAYLERYFDLSIFAHLGKRSFLLDGRRRIEVVRLSRGDLPDWISCKADLSSLTVAEAKGCHDQAGPAKALDRAWTQARRIDVKVGGRKVTIKRVAIATRWSTASEGPAEALLSVRDPVDEGDPIDQEDCDAVFLGLLRTHVANLIEPLGHAELADALRRLTRGSLPRALQRDVSDAQGLLYAARAQDVEGASDLEGLIGGIVTRAGPLTGSTISGADQDVLARLDLRPVFVGIGRDLVSAAIEGDAGSVRDQLKSTRKHEFARSDRAGGWIVPLGAGRRITGGA